MADKMIFIIRMYENNYLLKHSYTKPTVKGLQIVEQCDGFCYQFRRWSLHVVEFVDISDAIFAHAQHNIGQIGVPNLWVHWHHPLEVLFRVEAETFARPGSTCAAGSLDGGSLGYGLDQQGLDPSLGVKLLAFAESRVNDEHNAINCLCIVEVGKG
jgi:hypothetical protein